MICFLFCFSAYAYNYVYTSQGTDFSVDWVKYKSGGDIRHTYNAKTNIFDSYVYSSSAIFLTPSQQGYVASTTIAINNASESEDDWFDIGNGGWVASTKAKVSGQSYAKELQFYADVRTSSGTIINTWHWTYD